MQTAQAAWDRSQLQIALLLFLSLNFLFLLTSGGRVRTIDEVSVDYQAESLLTHGTTTIPQAVTSNYFYGRLDRWGQPRAPYGVAQAILILPWHIAARILLRLLPNVPATSKDLFVDAVVTASSATFCALASAIAFLILCRLGTSTKTALAALLLIALATPLFAYSAWFFSEPLVAALLLATALVLFPAGAASTPVRAAFAGVLLGTMIWVRPTHVVAAPVFLLALLIRDREKAVSTVLVLATVVGVFGGAYLLRNQIYFGNPLDFGYPSAAEGGKRLNSFDTPLFAGLFGFLFSPGKSVFLFAPPILLALAGIPKLAKRDSGLATICAGIPLAYLFFFARYTQWEGGYCIGPRYLVAALTLLCLPLGPLLAEAQPRSATRRLALVLFVFGVFVQVVSISTSFMEDQATGVYYDQDWNYRMTYSSITRQTALLAHYLGSSEPTRLGLGFDRWFVFLAKAGVPRGIIIAGIILEFTGFLFFAWKLKEAISSQPISAPVILRASGEDARRTSTQPQAPN